MYIEKALKLMKKGSTVESKSLKVKLLINESGRLMGKNDNIDGFCYMDITTEMIWATDWEKE